MKILFLLITLTIFKITNAQKAEWYICFNQDNNGKMAISAAFGGKNGYLLYLKYKGQKDSIRIKFVKEKVYMGGAHPTIDQTYNEIFNNKITGTYTYTHSGIWDYLQYKRKKDGKVFDFTINHDETYGDKEYREVPCY